MISKFKAGRVAIQFSTDGYPQSVEIQAEHANGQQMQKPLLLNHNDLFDIDYCLKRTIAAAIKGGEAQEAPHSPRPITLPIGLTPNYSLSSNPTQLHNWIMDLEATVNQLYVENRALRNQIERITDILRNPPPAEEAGIKNGDTVRVLPNLMEELDRLARFAPSTVETIANRYVGTIHTVSMARTDKNGQAWVTIGFCQEVPIQCCERVEGLHAN